MTTTWAADGRLAAAGSETVARYPSYGEAAAAVDRLAEMQFPVERVSIVGEGLRVVENVTGRTGLGTAILNGVVGGALIGVLFGWFLGLFGLADPLVNGIVLGWWGLVIGAILGALVGALMYWLDGRRRGFDSISSFHADAYCLMTDAEMAPRAATILRRVPESRKDDSA